jgi:hypothetical protein
VEVSVDWVLGGMMASVLAIESEVSGFNHGRGKVFLREIKIRSPPPVSVLNHIVSHIV